MGCMRAHARRRPFGAASAFLLLLLLRPGDPATIAWQNEGCNVGAPIGESDSYQYPTTLYLDGAFDEVDTDSYYAVGATTDSCYRGENALALDTDGILVRYSASNGSIVWGAQLNSSDGYLQFNSVTTLSDGGVVACGVASGSIALNANDITINGQKWGYAPGHGGTDAVIARFEADGTPNWGRVLGTSANDSCISIKQAKDGTLVWLGQTEGDLYGTHTNLGNDMVLGALNALTGTEIGAGFQLNVTANWTGQDLTVLGNSSQLMVLGTYLDTPTNIVGYTISRFYADYSNDFAVTTLYSATFISKKGDGFVTAATFTESNTILIAGYSSVSVISVLKSQSPFILQLSVNGTVICSTQKDITGGADQIFGVAVRGNTVFLGGATEGSFSSTTDGSSTTGGYPPSTGNFRSMIMTSDLQCSTLEPLWIDEDHPTEATKMTSLSLNKNGSAFGFVSIVRPLDSFASTSLLPTTTSAVTIDTKAPENQAIFSINSDDESLAALLSLDNLDLGTSPAPVPASSGSNTSSNSTVPVVDVPQISGGGGGGGGLSSPAVIGICVAAAVVVVGAGTAWWWVWGRRDKHGDGWSSEDGADDDGGALARGSEEGWGSRATVVDEGVRTWANAADGDVKESDEGASFSAATVVNSISHASSETGVAADVYFKTANSSAGTVLGVKSSSSSFSSRAEMENAMDRFEIDTKDIILLGKLGEGFFGTVYKARWQGQLVAVKSLKMANKKSLEALSREIGVMSAMRHPNVCLFYGCSRPPGTLIVSELLWGSLYTLLHVEKTPVDDVIKFRIMKDISRGLAYIHSKNFLHRDVSSSNVLLTASGAGLREMLMRHAGNNSSNDSDRVSSSEGQAFAKLTDFGLSRPAECSYMTSHAGNLFYMSPEVFMGIDDVTEAVDVYSFAITVWEMYKEEIPFQGINPQMVAYRTANEGLRLPLDQIPTGIALLLQDCWHADPKKRPSCGVVLDALESMEQVFVMLNDNARTLAAGGGQLSPDAQRISLRRGLGPLSDVSESARIATAYAYDVFDDRIGGMDEDEEQEEERDGRTDLAMGDAVYGDAVNGGGGGDGQDDTVLGTNPLHGALYVQRAASSRRQASEKNPAAVSLRRAVSVDVTSASSGTSDMSEDPLPPPLPHMRLGDVQLLTGEEEVTDVTGLVKANGRIMQRAESGRWRGGGGSGGGGGDGDGTTTPKQMSPLATTAAAYSPFRTHIGVDEGGTNSAQQEAADLFGAYNII